MTNQNKCDHIVGLYCSPQEPTLREITQSEWIGQLGFCLPDNQKDFKYCPDCGQRILWTDMYFKENLDAKG